jgi:ubiquinol-cytochrome c reductase iron-sulfur subunit
MPIATLSDPHLGDMAKNPTRAERIIALILVVAIVMIAGFGAAYWQNWNPWAIGATMGAGLFLLGFGLTAWGKYLMPQGPFVEERHLLASTPDERDSMSAALVERSAVVVKRRRMLGGLFALGAGVFGIVAAFPLIRSLGPVPGDSLTRAHPRSPPPAPRSSSPTCPATATPRSRSQSPQSGPRSSNPT